MSLGFAGPLMVGAVAGFALLTYLAHRRPMVIPYAVGAYALTAWDFPTTPGLVTVAGIQIKGEDVIVLAALATVLVRPRNFLNLVRRYSLLMMVIAICLLAALVAGYARFGGHAFNEFRGFFWLIGLCAWMLSLDWSSIRLRRSFDRWIIFMGIGLALAFVFHAAKYGMGTADSFVVRSDGTEQTGRPLVSGQALFLTLIGMLLLERSTERGRGGTTWLGIAFIAIAVLCQHRSVWAAVGVAIFLVSIQLRGIPLARATVGAFYGLVFLFALYATGALDGLLNSLAYGIESKGTYEGRVGAWTSLVDASVERGASSVLFGEPFGFGYDRYENGRFITYAPHNWYVSVYLRLGLIGLAAFLVVMLTAAKRLLAQRDVASMALLTATAIYAWSYSLPWYLGIPFGWCLYRAWCGRAGDSSTHQVTQPQATHYDSSLHTSRR